VQSGLYNHKKGEVVGPAGGETGGPRCLAEAHKAAKTAYFRCPGINVFVKKTLVKRKKQKPQELFYPASLPSMCLIISILRANCKPKTSFFWFIFDLLWHPVWELMRVSCVFLCNSLNYGCESRIPFCGDL
jgi:hypothetical protein